MLSNLLFDSFLSHGKVQQAYESHGALNLVGSDGHRTDICIQELVYEKDEAGRSRANIDDLQPCKSPAIGRI